MRRLRRILKYIVALVLGFLTVFKHAFKKRVTLEYPEKRPMLNENFRGEHALDIDKCTACGMCQRVCPSNAISIEKEGNSPKNYEISLERCIFCGNCAYYCPFGAIFMTKKFELADEKKSSLTLDINTLKKNCSECIMKEGSND